MESNIEPINIFDFDGTLTTEFSFFNDLLVDNNETISYEELMEGEQYIKYNLGVHQPKQEDEFYDYNNQIYKILYADGMVDFCCNADYSKGSRPSNILQKQK